MVKVLQTDSVRIDHNEKPLPQSYLNYWIFQTVTGKLRLYKLSIESSSYRFLSNDLLCPIFNLPNKISIMPHLAADKSFTEVSNFLAVYGSIAIDERLYSVFAKVEVKLYAV